MPEMLVQGGDVKKGAEEGKSTRTALRKKRRENRGRAGLPMKVRQTFLEELEKCSFIDLAAQAVGIAPSTPHRWAQASEQFAEAMKQAKEVADKTRLNVLERVTHDRAMKSSDLLAMFIMKKLDNSYRDHVVIGQGVGSVNLQVNLCTGAWPQPQPHEKSATEPSGHVIDLRPGQGES
ncbi:MAG: hypothetical protein O7E51_03475 [Acidobacteria bacterium]|nr:hypothetical protein [Acidobacteriota bacterium]